MIEWYRRACLATFAEIVRRMTPMSALVVAVVLTGGWQIMYKTRSVRLSTVRSRAPAVWEYLG